MSYAGERLIHDADSHLMELDDCLDPYFEARLLRRYRELPYLHRKNGDFVWATTACARQSDDGFRAGGDANILPSRTTRRWARSRLPTGRGPSTCSASPASSSSPPIVSAISASISRTTWSSATARLRPQPHDDGFLRGRSPSPADRLCPAGGFRAGKGLRRRGDRPRLQGPDDPEPRAAEAQPSHVGLDPVWAMAEEAGIRTFHVGGETKIEPAYFETACRG